MSGSFYETLGVSEMAEEEEIKSAFEASEQAFEAAKRVFEATKEKFDASHRAPNSQCEFARLRKIAKRSEFASLRFAQNGLNFAWLSLRNF
jgi:hypothetical protein